MKHLIFLMMITISFLSCDQIISHTTDPDAPEVSPNPEKVQVYVSDVKYEWIEITGGGAFPTDTIHHVDTRSWVEVKKKGKPGLSDYERVHLLPHPKAKATQFLRKRNWR